MTAQHDPTHKTAGPPAIPTLHPDISLRQLQALIRERYFKTDSARGTHATFVLLTEEFGELATALYNNNRESHGGPPPTAEERENLAEEFADVLAWLATLANINGVDLADACTKYTDPDRVKGVKA